MNAPDVISPRMQPFLPATADFVSGKDSPREFLERCIAALDAWEPKIGAFVTLDLAAGRAAADRSTKRWRAGKPLSAIDGMPIGVKDIIETIDMPTEAVRRYLPASAASATARALRRCARPAG